MMITRNRVVAACAAWVVSFVAGAAWAGPVLEFTFVGSGQTVAPTDDVVMLGRVTNVGDAGLVDALAFGGIDVFGGAPDVSNNYVEAYPPGFAFGPDGLFSLNAGDSVTFTMAIWQPWPITGNPGDPVPEGTYVVPGSAFSSIDFVVFAPYNSYAVDLSGAGDFVWTVASNPPPPIDPTPVPSPAAAGAGLVLLMTMAARRRARHA